MSGKGDTTREQIVIAATRLFYGEGIRAVSMDAVAEKAGVTKKTLYYHFETKDELITAYLASRDQPTLAYYARWFAETDGSTADKVRGLFNSFGKAADTPNWRGCGFLRTIAELANTPGHPAIKAGAAHKKKFEAWLADILARLHDRDVAAVRAALGEAAFAAVWDEGRAMTIEQAIDEALNH